MKSRGFLSLSTPKASHTSLSVNSISSLTFTAPEECLASKSATSTMIKYLFSSLSIFSSISEG